MASLALEVLLGDQRPRLESRPPAVASYGDVAVDFAAAAGIVLDDWQQYVLWALHDVDERDRWAGSEAGLLVSRQQGKTEILVAFDLCRLFLFPMADLRRRTVLHTAHEVKTATESFEALKAVIESQARLSAMVDHIYSANGKEAIVLKKRRGQRLGDRVRFVARSKGSGRGFAAADIVFDASAAVGADVHDDDDPEPSAAVLRHSAGRRRGRSVRGCARSRPHRFGCAHDLDGVVADRRRRSEAGEDDRSV